jgi:hypothetical protein
MSSPPQIARQGQSWESIAIIIDAQNRVRHIGKELRHEFDEIAHEPLPREFIDLLDRLGRQSKDKKPV